jgi:hypothetical protein
LAFTLLQESFQSSSPSVPKGSPEHPTLDFSQQFLTATRTQPLYFKSVDSVRISFLEDDGINFVLNRTEIDMPNIPATPANQMMVMPLDADDVPVFRTFPVHFFENPKLYKKIDGPEKSRPTKIRIGLLEALL